MEKQMASFSQKLININNEILKLRKRSILSLSKIKIGLIKTKIKNETITRLD